MMPTHHETIIGLLESKEKLFVEFGVQKSPVQVPNIEAEGQVNAVEDSSTDDFEVIETTECHKPRLLYSQHKLKNRQPDFAKRMVKKLDYVCGASLSEYMGTGGDKDEQLLKVIFVRENLSCSSNIEVPYYGVDHFPVVCIYCGVTGTKRTLNESVENYPKCNRCGDKPDIVKRKRKALVQKDLGSKKKK